MPNVGEKNLGEILKNGNLQGKPLSQVSLYPNPATSGLNNFFMNNLHLKRRKKHSPHGESGYN